MITTPELALLALAGYRATRLAVHDTILSPYRHRLTNRHAARPGSRILTFLVELIACIYCTGWWIAGAILTTYLLATGQFTGTPLLIHGIEWFAVAGGAALLNRADDTLQELT